MMGLETAIKESWEKLSGSELPERSVVKFLGDEYRVDSRLREVVLFPGSTPAEDHVVVLILHYLLQKVSGLPVESGEYLGFSGLSAGNGFAQVFKKRCTDVILERYGDNPPELLAVLQTLPAEKTDRGDTAIIVEAFEGVPVIIEIWKGDEDFPPEVNILFDKSIIKIFCTEDISVLADVVARAVALHG